MICPSCGRTAGANEPMCLMCGRPLVDLSAAQPSNATPEPLSTAMVPPAAREGDDTLIAPNSAARQQRPPEAETPSPASELESTDQRAPGAFTADTQIATPPVEAPITPSFPTPTPQPPLTSANPIYDPATRPATPMPMPQAPQLEQTPTQTPSFGASVSVPETPAFDSTPTVPPVTPTPAPPLTPMTPSYGAGPQGYTGYGQYGQAAPSTTPAQAGAAPQGATPPYGQSGQNAPIQPPTPMYGQGTPPYYGQGTMPQSPQSPQPQSPQPPPSLPQFPRYGGPAAPSAGPYGAGAPQQQQAPAPPSIPVYGGPGAPVYGQPAPPYGGTPTLPYGQAAPPSAPMYGAGAPPWGPQTPLTPPTPPRSNRTIAIVSVVVVVALLLIAGLGYIAIRANQSSTGQTPPSTPTATIAPTATPANVIYSESLLGTADNWANDSHCFVQSDGYHAKDGYICFAPTDALTDGSVTVDAKQIAGATNQSYGIVVRRTSANAHYEFDVTAAGEWAFYKCTASTCNTLTTPASNPAIHTGLNVVNTLKVVMTGSQFDLYVNGSQVGSASDSTYTSGVCGVSADSNMEAVYTNIEITD